jgi:transcription elongation factor Elf1
MVMNEDRRQPPHFRCPACGGSVSLATGVVNLTTGVREAVCWECGQHVRWAFDTKAEEHTRAGRAS